jgi:hypothetical protein
MVKGPRWNKLGAWSQQDDHIVQQLPENASEIDLQKHMHEDAYVAMCYAKKIKMAKKVICSSVMSFDYRMAPLIVIAPELGKNEQFNAPEFREHWEIVLYDLGINVWHHYMTADGKPAWHKAASLLLKPDNIYKPNLRHDLKVSISKSRKGHKEMFVTCGDYVLQYVDESLPDEFYAGILGCEGRNMFYDFSVKSR